MIIDHGRLLSPLGRKMVPCNGCRLCCQGELVMLFPEKGDDVSSYDHVSIHAPVDGATNNIECSTELSYVKVLKRKPNGDCVYLDDHGCSIHDRAPVMCKAFDCRLNFLKYSRNERRVMVRDGLASKEMFDAGRKRLASLGP